MLLRNTMQKNKGFSLVELIVVVLIIAIISVALAPQVMRWVGTSRINVDKNNASILKSAIHAGVAEYMATNNIYSIADTGTANLIVDGIAPANSDLGDAALQIQSAVDDNWPESEATSDGFRLNITTSGGVTVEYSDPSGGVGNWVKSK